MSDEFWGLGLVLAVWVVGALFSIGTLVGLIFLVKYLFF